MTAKAPVPLTDAQVQVVSDSRVPGTDTQTTTNGDGRFLLTLDAATPAVLRFSKTGHASSVRAVDAASQNEAVAPRVILLPVAATQSFDATEAQVLRVPGSTARVALSAASLVRDDGQPISGAVTVALTPVDPSADPLRMPGLMVDADSGTPIESLGALGIEFTDASGAPLNLASGQTAVIRIPATPAPGATLPASFPLYHLNETTGLWEREGTATLHTDPVSGDAYYEATVSHFSWWNADQEITRSTINLGATGLQAQAEALRALVGLGMFMVAQSLMVGAAVFVRRGAHRDEQHPAVLDRQLFITGETQPSGFHAVAYQARQAGFENTHMTLFEQLDLVLVNVHAHHVMADFGQHRSLYQAHVATADYTDFHEAFLTSEGRLPRELMMTTPSMTKATPRVLDRLKGSLNSGRLAASR
mgnify:CR=1 FL=1